MKNTIYKSGCGCYAPYNTDSNVVTTVIDGAAVVKATYVRTYVTAAT